MCAVIFACHNWGWGGGVGSAIGGPWVQSRSFPTQRVEWSQPARNPGVDGTLPPGRDWAFCVGLLWSCHCLPTPGLVASIAPPSFSIFYSSPLHTHTPVPLASRPPRHSIAGATSPRVLSPPFILCLAGVADRLSGRSQPVAARGFRDRAARCTRPACPLIGRAAVSMVISRKARPPPLSSLPPPPRPYSVARAATGRLIKQEPREEPGCGPRSQRGGPPRAERTVGVGSEELAEAQFVPTPLQPIRGSTHCRCWGCARSGILGVHFLIVRLPTMASRGSVTTLNTTSGPL